MSQGDLSKRRLTRRDLLRGLGGMVAGVTVLPILSACSSSGSTASPTAAPAGGGPTSVPGAASAPTAAAAQKTGGQISVLVASDKAWVPDLIKKFQTDTGINVNPVIVDWNDLSTKFTVAAAGGGSTYDVVDVDPSVHGSFMKAGYLEPLDSYLAPVKSDLVNPNIFSYNGKIYGMPWFTDALFFFYNKDMLDKAGITAPPTTWDELRTQATTLQQKGLSKYPFSFEWKQIEGEFDLYMTFLFGNGGKLLDDSLTKPLFNSPEGVGALQYLRDLYAKDKLVDPGSFNMRPLEVMTEMAQGRAAYAIIWGEVAGGVNDASKSQVAGKIGSAVIPVAKAGVPSTTVDGSECLAIPSKSTNKDAAWKFIQYFTSKQQSKAIYQDSGALPVWRSVFDDPDLSKNPWTKTFLDQLKNDYTRPGQSWYGEFSQTMQVETINALNGSKSPQQALDDAAKKATDILKKG